MCSLIKRIFFALNIVVFLAGPLMAAATSDVPRMSVDELKSRLDRGEDIVILDVRTPSSYARSKVSVKGAIRIPPKEIDKRARDLPMGKVIVLYCT